MKIVFAQYHKSKDGSIKHDFTAYEKFKFFGQFNKAWNFWYHDVDGWCMSIGFNYDMTEDEMVKKFEAVVKHDLEAKVIWIDGDKFAYKLRDGSIKIR